MREQGTEWRSFSQSIGLAPLPQRLQLGVFDERARNILHAVIYDHLMSAGSVDDYTGFSTYNDSTRYALKSLWIYFWGHKVEEFSGFYQECPSFFQFLFQNGDYNNILDIVQFFCTYPEVPWQIRSYFIERYREAFVLSRIAYALDSTGHIVPIASPEEGMAIQKALSVTNTSNFHVVRKHLLDSGQCIDDGDWRGSIRESIHAVEAVGRLILKDPNATLGDMIKLCDRHIRIHSQLKAMLNNFSGYANDHARHAEKPDSLTPPDMADAVLLFGSCASFVTYLISKSGLSASAAVA